MKRFYAGQDSYLEQLNEMLALMRELRLPPRPGIYVEEFSRFMTWPEAIRNMYAMAALLRVECSFSQDNCLEGLNLLVDKLDEWQKLRSLDAVVQPQGGGVVVW